MVSMIGSLSFVLALAASSYALSCIQCTSESSECSGDSATCPPNHLCGSTYTETSISGKTSALLHKACAPLSECGFNGSISIKKGHIRMVIACCSSDNCTASIPEFPTQSSIPNGVICPSCVSADSTWCYSPKTIQCRGDESVCLLQTTKVTGSISSSIALRGCSTKSFCDLGSQSQEVGGTSTKVKFICTNGGNSVHKVLLTPATACLLLLKFFVLENI
ncbi:phospholipase A2 inhibitor and Ly6/PLAUR domain-containing protein-like [Engystomops pustulosus]|uniref:phospholipase A2 inhibitor and Ly6/PLAUR domain-containing protein-like n=1 Tax=Engystomops pustulosus TaxID=76066 RepID=UPI003AFA6F2B